jgi:hypothetical protein
LGTLYNIHIRTFIYKKIRVIIQNTATTTVTLIEIGV